ncbi:hypothetical protein ACJX0J_025630, partial [Zea mays]
MINKAKYIFFASFPYMNVQPCQDYKHFAGHVSQAFIGLIIVIIRAVTGESNNLNCFSFSLTPMLCVHWFFFSLPLRVQGGQTNMQDAATHAAVCMLSHVLWSLGKWIWTRGYINVIGVEG